MNCFIISENHKVNKNKKYSFPLSYKTKPMILCQIEIF